MRARLLTVIGLAAALSARAASAGGPGYYVTGEGGVSLLPDLHLGNDTGVQHDSFGTGIAAGGALGYDMGNGWRVELASLYQHSDVDRLNGTPADGHLSSTSLMANATYDLMPNTFVTPYIGAGLGLQNVGGEVNALSGRAWEPAYQAEAGLRHEVSDRVSMFGEYRFSQSESVTMSDATDSEHQHFSDHALLAGLSFKLD